LALRNGACKSEHSRGCETPVAPTGTFERSSRSNGDPGFPTTGDRSDVVFPVSGERKPAVGQLAVTAEIVNRE